MVVCVSSTLLPRPGYTLMLKKGEGNQKTYLSGVLKSNQSVNQILNSKDHLIYKFTFLFRVCKIIFTFTYE